MLTLIETPIVTIDFQRYGGPYDRGSADRYYGRPFKPHFYVGNSYMSEKITQEFMTPEEVQDYIDGWEQEEDRKDWGHHD